MFEDNCKVYSRSLGIIFINNLPKNCLCAPVVVFISASNNKLKLLQVIFKLPSGKIEQDDVSKHFCCDIAKCYFYQHFFKERVHFLRDYFVLEYSIASIIDLLLFIQNKTKIRYYRL